MLYVCLTAAIVAFQIMFILALMWNNYAKAVRATVVGASHIVDSSLSHIVELTPGFFVKGMIVLGALKYFLVGMFWLCES